MASDPSSPQAPSPDKTAQLRVHASTLTSGERLDTADSVLIPPLPTYPPPPSPAKVLIIPSTNESFANLFTRASDTSTLTVMATRTGLRSVASKSTMTSGVSSGVSSTDTFYHHPINDVAAMRFIEFIEHHRLIPPHYSSLPSSFQWLEPPRFNTRELSRSKDSSPIVIESSHILGSYHDANYYGTRRSFRIDPSVVSKVSAHRGTPVIFEGVRGVGVSYYANRIRAVRGRIADVELVAFTEDGDAYSETSLGWPPIVIELPKKRVKMPTGQDLLDRETDELFKDWLDLSFLFGCFKCSD